jgi:prolyl-tRNA editing enzyme YbaK/EbsC (Cys-tRNA(Pro) deacylase)
MNDQASPKTTKQATRQTSKQATRRASDPILAHPAVQRVRQALLAAGLADTIIVMDEATHTAQAAAAALGCAVAEIAKSIIFRAASERAVLVITSGSHRVDDKKVAALINEKIGKADADFVREHSGFVIGGVAPLAHLRPPLVLMDEALLVHGHIYPAAGHPNSMFRIAPAELARIAGARIADIAQASAQPGAQPQAARST